MENTTQVQVHWKFLREQGGRIVSDADDSAWTIGKWREVKGDIRACRNGFHCSPDPLGALLYVNGDVVAQVEVGGPHDDGGDKSAWQRMRIVRAWRWRTEDSVRLATFAAGRVLSIYEDAYPGDDRPRAAIAAARAYLDNPSDAAARAADAAYAARAARAARAAAAAAYAVAAAGAEMRQRVIGWMIRHIETLPVIETTA